MGSSSTSPPPSGEGLGLGSAPALTAQQQHDELLDISDVLHKRIISTALRGNITIRAENAAAALEVMSRFAADPRWEPARLLNASATRHCCACNDCRRWPACHPT